MTHQAEALPALPTPAARAGVSASGTAGFSAGLAALVGGALAMGISPVLVRLADVGPFASAFYRVALALPALYAWTRIEDRSRRAAGVPVPALSEVAGSMALTGFIFTLDLFFWHLAILKTTVANATFFATTAPVWVVVFGWALFGRRPGGAALAGLGLCLLGGAALVGQSFAIAPERLTGDLLSELTAVFFGAYFLAVERGRGRLGPARLTFLVSVVTAVLLGLVAVGAEMLAGQRLLPAHATGWLVLAVLALISHAGGQGLLSVALGILPAMFSSLVIFLEAVAAALFGWAILGEAVTAVQALGGIAIVLGIVVARPRQPKQAPLPPAVQAQVPGQA